MRVLACVPLIIVTTFAPVLATELAPADLASLLDEVDAANPEVLALAARAQAASEVPGQLEALPDPKLSVSYTNDGLDQITLGSSIMSNLALAWEQTVPYRSVRARAADVGRADAEVAQRTTATVRARVRARVIGLFADLYRLDRSIDIVGESRALLLAAYETAQARYESGEGIQEGLLRAQTEIRRLDLESETLGRERRTVEIAMEAALGLLCLQQEIHL